MTPLPELWVDIVAHEGDRLHAVALEPIWCCVGVVAASNVLPSRGDQQDKAFAKCSSSTSRTFVHPGIRAFSTYTVCRGMGRFGSVVSSLFSTSSLDTHGLQAKGHLGEPAEEKLASCSSDYKDIRVCSSFEGSRPPRGGELSCGMLISCPATLPEYACHCIRITAACMHACMQNRMLMIHRFAIFYFVFVFFFCISFLVFLVGSMLVFLTIVVTVVSITLLIVVLLFIFLCVMRLTLGLPPPFRYQREERLLSVLNSIQH